MSQTHLFLDDTSILRKIGLTREWHPAEKIEQDPIIVAEHPWERRFVYVHGTAIRDRVGDKEEFIYESR